jgi:BMFP domain-containing protein YqiC
MTGAMGVAAGHTDEAKSFLKAQAAKLIAEMDLVGREEFEAMKEMAASAKAEVTTLQKRLADIEEKLGKHS